MAFIDDFRVRFPEIPTTNVDTYIPRIEPELPCFYFATYNTGNECDDTILLYVAAHLLTLEVQAQTNNASKKDVVSKSVGNVSITYGAVAATDNTVFYNSTVYGQRALQIMKNNSVGGFFV